MSHLFDFGSDLPGACRALLEVGVRLMIQSSLLLAGGLLAGWALRHGGPARRLLVYKASLGAVALGAACSVVLAGRLPSIFALTLPPAVTLPVPDPGRSKKAAPDGLFSTSPTFRPPATAMAAANGSLWDAAGQRVSVEVVPGPMLSAGELKRASAPFNGFQKPEQAFRISSIGRVYLALAGLWLGVAALLIGWLALCYAGIHRICRRARMAQDETLCEQLAALCDAYDVTVPALLISKDVSSVFLAGVWRPAILLPADYARRFDPATLNAVLAHEVTHLRSRDGVWTLTTRLLCALLWVQPLLWRVGQRREQVSEEVCDQAVIGQGCSPRAYADCLVTLAEQLRPSRAELVAGSGSVVFRSSLAQRVQKLMSGDWRQSVPVTRRFRFAVSMGSLMLALLLSLTVSAAPRQTAQTMQSDPRLQQKVVVSAEGVPLGDLLALLSRKIGVDLSASADLADDKFIVFGPPRPLHALLEDMAALLDTVWIVGETKAGPPRYILVQEVKAKHYEQNLADEADRRIQAKLDEQILALGESPEQLAKRAENDPIRLALTNPDGRASTSVFACLTPQQRQQLLDRWFVRLPLSAAPSTAKDAIEGLYHGKRLDDLNDNPLVRSGAAIPNPSVSREAMEREVVTFTLTKMPGGGGSGSDLQISMNTSTGLNMLMTKIHTDVGFLLPAHGNPYTGQPVSKRASLPQAQDVQDAAQGALPDRLRLLAEKTGQPILSDYFRSKPLFTPEGEEQETSQPPFEALDRFCRPQGYLWWNRGKTLLLRKRDWYTQQRYEIPDRWEIGFIQHLKAQKGVLTYGDMVSLLQLSSDQIAGLNESASGRMSDRQEMAGLREMLALVAASPGDKSKPLHSRKDGVIVAAYAGRAAIMPDLSDPAQRALLADFVQAWSRQISLKDIMPGDFGFILHSDPEGENAKAVKVDVMIYPGKGVLSFGYMLNLPLNLPDDRRDKTRVELAP